MYLSRPTILAAALVLGGLASGRGADAGRRALPGHVPPVVSHLTPLGRLPATNTLRLAIGLPLQNQGELDELIRQLYNPASTNFHRYLTPQEFTARFGPAESDYAAVKEFARTNGLAVTATHDSRLLLDVNGSAAAVEKAFHITLRTYRHPAETRDFYAPDTEPAVAAGLPVADIQGLTDYYRLYPKNHLMTSPARSGAVAKSGSAPDGSGSYFGNDFQNAYVPGTTLTGAGQMVGLLEFDGFYASDIARYAAAAGGGRTNIVIQTVLLDNYNGSITSANGNAEVSLDIELAMAMAPGLSRIVVFEAPNNTAYFNDVLNAMASTNIYPLLNNLSCSWGGGGPSPSSETIFKKMAAQGQSFFNASGDADAFTGSVPFPSESTNITQVGGTTLSMNGAGDSYASETAWNRNNGTGSSGGISTTYGMPFWQQGISMVANGGSTTMRNIPDVALTAENCYVMLGNGGSGNYGGTSCAAPLWAGFTALVNEQAVLAGKSSVGFINPAVYELASESIYNSVFHDITTGDNTWSSSPNAFYAVPGYDLCTGLGTPAGTNLINALVAPDPLVILTNSGFAAAGKTGGPFSPSSKDYFFTNTGASPLDWSIINTSVWLNVSAGSGTLPVGTSNAVTVSVSAAANSLAIGTYATTLWFSNATTSVAHGRLFTLQITDPLVLLTTNGFSAYGPAGGPFYPGTQAVVLTNLGVGAVSWGLINTSSWLSVSSSSGSIPGNSSASVTVSTNSGASALANGIYNATLVLSNQSSHVTQSLVFSALVGTNVVQNGGFETGDFSSWTQSGNTAFTSVTSGDSSFVHSGTYGMKAGPSASQGYISQNLPTCPGQTYLLSFWLSNPTSGSTEIFLASWNGVNAYGVTNPGVLAWTNRKFIVTAAGTNSVLKFAVRNDPGYFGFDDASVTPVLLPAITQQPASQTNFAGSNVVFTAVAAGTAPLTYHWRTNGVNLVNGAGIAGATTNVLALTAITTNSAANYTLVVTNLYGSITSSVAALTVVFAPSITTNLVTQTVECGGNAGYIVGAAGTAPLRYQWRTNGVSIAGATTNSLILTNVHLSGFPVTVVVTNLYGSATSSVPLTVQDTLAPVVTLNGGNLLTNELGSVFTDPGATASDTCAGIVSVTASGTVNTGVVGTNVIFYKAGDGNGNTNTVTRTVIVRDTKPPVISWSFTNLVLAANSNCVATMPDVTGTNFILATDLSGAVVITQSPTNSAVLPLGTNVVILTARDNSGNAAFSTNKIVVQDQAPPVIVGQPQSRTNFAGTTASFSVAATACTPLAFRWFFNHAALTAQTGSTLTLSNLTTVNAGNYFVIATASGGSSTSIVATLTVNLLASSVALASSSNPGGFKDDLNFTAAVTPASATGTIQFLTNGAAFDLEPLISGSAISTNLSTLPRGTNLIAAVYSGDAGCLPSTNTLAQIVTNHPPVVSPAFYTLVAGLKLNITVADLATNWSDADGDALFIAAISASTNGVVVANALPVLFYSNPNYVDDQFVCAISDGFGGTNFQAVNITVVPQTNSMPVISSATRPPAGGGVNLQLEGGYGSTYVLESTTNFISAVWEPVATNTLDITGVWQFTDFGVTNIPARFYRLKLVQ